MTRGSEEITEDDKATQSFVCLTWLQVWWTLEREQQGQEGHSRTTSREDYLLQHAKRRLIVQKHLLLFILVFLWLIRTIQYSKSQESQYCKMLQGWRNDLVTNWVLHINVQCPSASYLWLPFYLIQEQWTNFWNDPLNYFLHLKTI